MILGNYPLSSLSNFSSVTSLLKTTFPVSTDSEVSAQRGCFSLISLDKILLLFSISHEKPLVRIVPSLHYLSNDDVHVIFCSGSSQLSVERLSPHRIWLQPMDWSMLLIRYKANNGNNSNEALTPHTERLLCGFRFWFLTESWVKVYWRRWLWDPSSRSSDRISSYEHTNTDSAGPPQLWLWMNICKFSVSLFFVQDYNLTDEIEQADEFTVFAPTDVAITNYLRNMAATALV